MRFYTAWSNISLHLFNCVFGLAEVLFTNIPPAPWLTLPFGLLILAGYLGVAYITNETQHFYSYSFLDPQKQGGLLAAYIAGIGVGFTVVFIAIRYIIVLRIWVVSRIHARRSEGRSVGSEAIDDWDEMETSKDPSGVAV
ncbi:hypothetical protein DXG03_004135 [Asterophora parasitica]|uniref:Uncharacterized protein n=1 Tax=Asterophora parasitica TaxID=117018 RepID=A0A9P7G7E6_9AGAR|nr:hypothetical protein DXG03_004135 [Asterophora parasitica]